MKIKLLILLGAVSLLILTACRSEPNTPSINPTQGVEMLTGVYTTEIDAQDLENFSSNDPGLANNTGVWTITLKDDGNLEATLDGRFIANGDYEVTGDRIKVALSNVCDDCDCAGFIGRYVWGLNGDQLAFARVAGSCRAMDLVLTSQPLTRQKRD
jgi:hypothetical protein